MSRRKTWFTQRELEKLSKTHAGRLKIYRAYIIFSIFIIICAIPFIILGFKINANIVIGLGFLAIVVNFIVLIVNIFLFKNEKQEEKQRIEERRIEEEKQLNYEKKLKEEQEILLKKEEERKEAIKLKFKNSSIEQIDLMTGYEFESFVSEILSDLGYITIATTKSGDFGADIIIEKNCEKTIIQTKRFAKKVPISAVQQISSAKAYFGINNAWVITNNYFTAPAIELAKSNNVILFNREDLCDLIIKAKGARNNKLS